MSYLERIQEVDDWPQSVQKKLVCTFLEQCFRSFPTSFDLFRRYFCAVLAFLLASFVYLERSEQRNRLTSPETHNTF
jgi:hypothetical protein